MENPFTLKTYLPGQMATANWPNLSQVSTSGPINLFLQGIWNWDLEMESVGCGRQTTEFCEL